jgi:phasin
MPDNKPPDSPPAKRNNKGIVQSDAESRSAKKTTSKKSPKKFLPPRQVEESSKDVELAVGEWPFTSPMEETAIVMDPKMTMQVPDAVRNLVAKAIDQAENAFGIFFDAANKSMALIPSPGTEIPKHALSFTEQNMKAAFDHARRLVHATDLQEAMRIQSEFLKSQFANAGEQIRKISGEVMSTEKDVSSGK